jgi:dipeptidase D
MCSRYINSKKGSAAMEKDIAVVLEYFEQINAIPRCSKDEARIAHWLIEWAEARNYEHGADAVGNLVVRVPATPGMEHRPTVILQGHMDMVCEKTPDSPHNFATDPIKSSIAGDWLSADRTTLGADNGIALAYALAIVDDNAIRRPPLELLFTVDEETGLTGVKDMDPALISGKFLINLDSEDEGVFTIGCAGGANIAVSMNLSTAARQDETMYRVVVGGLRGGHSGIDIDKQRGNANQILARALLYLGQEIPLRIATWTGGTRHNAIARDATAVIACPTDQTASIPQSLARMAQTLRTEYAGVEQALTIDAAPHATSSGPPLTVESTQRVLDLLMALPHGVAGMSATYAGLVETSSNLATVEMTAGSLRLLVSVRSALPSRLEEIKLKVIAIARLAGAQVYEDNHYPPWPPDNEAFLLGTAQSVYAGLFGKEPQCQVIHAGLECAIIGNHYPAMQMISFGPTIQNPHSPTERLHIPSVGKVWRFLVALLEGLNVDGK